MDAESGRLTVEKESMKKKKKTFFFLSKNIHQHTLPHHNPLAPPTGPREFPFSLNRFRKL